MTGQSPDVRKQGRLRRRLRSVAVLTAVAIAAPLGLVATAASPAGAAPATIRISGDPATVNGGFWVWGGTHFTELRGLLTTTDFGEATYDVDNTGMSPLALNSSVDVFFGGAVEGGYTGAERTALMNWIQAGGVYVAANNTSDRDITAFLPGSAQLEVPPAQWEQADPGPNVHACQQVTPTNDCYGDSPFSAPAAATVVNAGNATVSALVNGPHGPVSSIRNWHTVTVYNSLPSGAIAVANLVATCTPPGSPTPEQLAACEDQNPDPEQRTYENNLNGTVFAVVPFGTAGYGSGTAVVMSDGDVFSNAYGSMAPGNRNLAENLFQWIGDHFTSQPTNPYPTYVNAAYEVLLNRPADSAGSSYWSSLLTGGMPRQDFAYAIARQPEWVNGVVTDIYQDVFNRAPDAGGLAYWSGQVQQGLRVSVVASLFYASDEYFTTAGGGTVQGWVTAMYQDILGRAPDANGLNYWVGQINAGTPATALAGSLYLSLEANVQRVDALYAHILNRAPDAGGRAYWGGLLATLDDIALAAQLVASDEFYSRSLSGELPA